MRATLNKFITGLYRASSNCCHVYEELLLSINALLERLVVASTADQPINNSSSGEHGRSAGSRGREKPEASQEKEINSQIVEFALEIIEDVCKLRQFACRIYQI